MLKDVEAISEVIVRWGMNEGHRGTDALMRCAIDAMRLILEGEPWCMKRLYSRYAKAYGGSYHSVGLSIEHALAAAGVRQTNKGAISALVGYALRAVISEKETTWWNEI